MFGNPIIRRIGTCGDGDIMEFRIAAGAQTAIADDMHGKAVTERDARDFFFHRTRIAIEKNLKHHSTSGLMRPALGSRTNLLRRACSNFVPAQWRT